MDVKYLPLYIFLFTITVMMVFAGYQMFKAERERKGRVAAEDQLFVEQAKTARLEAENRAKDQGIADHRDTIAKLVTKLRKS